MIKLSFENNSLSFQLLKQNQSEMDLGLGIVLRSSEVFGGDHERRCSSVRMSLSHWLATRKHWTGGSIKINRGGASWQRNHAQSN